MGDEGSGKKLEGTIKKTLIVKDDFSVIITQMSPTLVSTGFMSN